MRLLMAVTAALMLSASVASAGYIASAVNEDGFSSGSGATKEAARTIAENRCERKTGSPCYESVSVEDDWFLVVVKCGSRGYAVAASQIDFDAAKDNAAEKIGANPRNCQVLATD